MMTKSKGLSVVLVAVLALASALAPATSWAQAQAPSGPMSPQSVSALTADDPGRSRYISELPAGPTTENSGIGASFINILHVPGKAILCSSGAVLSTIVLLATFGSGYELAIKTFEEGCHGTWVLKPEHVSGQIQRPPDL